MDARQLIERKRDGGRLAPDEWTAFIRAYAAGQITDYQMSAFLMACFIRGLDRAETAALTEAMLGSGGRLELDHLGKARIDKHSTGGVGDKVSIILAPLVSCLGVAVPMMSGRGLGHTGGTLDKLEAIPGFRTRLSLAEAGAELEAIGCALIGQTEEIAPADRKMYALRDATATVESIPLISASIMSKKLAEGLTGLVLDVKRGSGAFLPELDAELELAGTMVSLGADHGCPVVALLTAMDRPLGRACGNALETEEAIHALRGEGPPDLMDVTYALGAEMLLLAGTAANGADARRRLEGAIASGQAARQFQRIIEAQGGNPAVVDDPALLPQARECELFAAPRRGVVARIEPRSRLLLYTSAGHPPGLVVSSAERLKAILPSTDVPLGILQHASFPLGEAVMLEPSDVVIFATDGLLEAMSDDRELFGTRRVLEVVFAHWTLNAQDMAVALCKAAREFGGAPQQDDITALVIKV
ncbi:MAG: thymidine phosphorylase [Gemmatimonadetes bacterium 21-71-4]|nr:MAG: thymidine phosphorylase [Gemmatimonadetes bacterium 21-71-4]